MISAIIRDRRLEALGIVCGEVSGGLLVLDLDVPRFYDLWLQEVGADAEGLPVAETGKGIHVICDATRRVATRS